MSSLNYNGSDNGVGMDVGMADANNKAGVIDTRKMEPGMTVEPGKAEKSEDVALKAAVAAKPAELEEDGSHEDAHCGDVDPKGVGPDDGPENTTPEDIDLKDGPENTTP